MLLHVHVYYDNFESKGLMDFFIHIEISVEDRVEYFTYIRPAINLISCNKTSIVERVVEFLLYLGHIRRLVLHVLMVWLILLYW